MLIVFTVLSVVNALLFTLNHQNPGWLTVLLFILIMIASFLAAFLVYILLLWIGTLFIDRRKEKKEANPFLRFILKETCGLVLFFLWTGVHVEGKELLPEGTFLLVGNHRSGFDPIATLWGLRDRRINFVSKKSNFDIPIGGPLMEECGFLTIDREDDRKGLQTILTVAERMQEGICSFAIYPEGTRNRGEGLLPFRNGCFKAAQRAGVPIVVITTKNTELIRKHAPWRPTMVELTVCGVLDAEYVKTHRTNEIGVKVAEMMLESLGE